MEDRLLYRVPEVAVILNISRSKVYELFSSGDLESVKIDRIRLVDSSDLRASHIDAWKVELNDRGLAESSIRTAYTVLRAALDTAVRDKAIAHNPAHAVRRPKVTANEAAYITPDQVARFWPLRKEADTHHSSRCSSTAACGEAKRSPSTGLTLILTPSCYGYVAPWPRLTASSSSRKRR
jgi:excisionase family DNA binding protein